MRTFLAGALSVGLAAFAAAGPVGPPAGAPILDSTRVQTAQANISSITVRDLFTGTTMVAYVLNLYGAGPNQYSLILSSGMHVLAGGITAPFFVGSGAGLTGVVASSASAAGVTFGTFQNGPYAFPNSVNFPYGVWTASGNVGINTTTPGFALDVNGSINFSGVLTGPTISSLTASTQATAGLLATFGISTNSLQAQLLSVGASTATLRLLADALGISTNSLQGQLYAVGTATAAHQAQLAGVAVATTSLQNQQYAAGSASAALQVQIYTLGTSTNSLQSQLLSVGASTTSLYNLAGILGISTNTLRGIIDTLGTSTNTLQAQFVLVGSSTNTLRILADALGVSTNSIQVQVYNVGVATGTLQASKVSRSGDSMTGPLTMAGGSTITVTGNEFSVGGTILYVKSDGNIGIGTTSPSSPLGFTPSLYMKGAFPSLILDSSGGHRFEIGSNSPAGLNIYDVTAGVLRVIIQGGGNFGIGVAAPDALLHVGGQIHADTNITASSASFTASGNNTYSMNLSSGINAPNGTIIAGMLVGDGSRITGITTTNSDPAVGQSTAALRALADALGISTNSLQAQLILVGASTQTLYNLAGALGTSTNTLRILDNAMGISTNSLQAQLILVGASTQTLYNLAGTLGISTSALRAVVDALGTSTNTLQSTKVNRSGDIMTGPLTVTTFTATGQDAAGYSMTLSTGLNMPNGTLLAKVLVGDGSRITNLPSSGGGSTSTTTYLSFNRFVNTSTVYTAIPGSTIAVNVAAGDSLINYCIGGEFDHLVAFSRTSFDYAMNGGALSTAGLSVFDAYTIQASNVPASYYYCTKIAAAPGTYTLVWFNRCDTGTCNLGGPNANYPNQVSGKGDR